MEDTVIYVNDIIMRVLLKWKFILLCMVLGAALMSGYSIYKQKQEAAAAAALPKEKSEIFTSEAAAVKANLSDRQQTELKTTGRRRTVSQAS